MASLKELYNRLSRDRQTFPGVVVPLANGSSSPDRSSSDAPAPSPLTEEEKKNPDAEKKPATTTGDDSNTDERLATATLQETGNRYVSPRNKDDSNSARNGLTLESLRAEVETETTMSGLDTAYDRKSKVINLAIQDIGMGRYQWELYVLCGLGWVADK